MKWRSRDCSRLTTSEIRWSCSSAIGSTRVAASFIYGCRRMRGCGYCRLDEMVGPARAPGGLAMGIGNTPPTAGVEAERYRPAPRGSRKGIGICLSGGGYRATLFHMGALRRLNELGVLAHRDLRTISSVSGGSITSAFLALAFKWPVPGVLAPTDREARFSRPL